jgi:hypothetical protein
MRRSGEDTDNGGIMDTNEISSKVTWYGKEHLVRVEWDSISGDVIGVRCSVDGKAVVKFVKGRWIDKKGKRYDADYFRTLKRCCTDNFKDAKFLSLAFVPILSIYLGEEM